jgi:hypothetical protein
MSLLWRKSTLRLALRGRDRIRNSSSEVTDTMSLTHGDRRLQTLEREGGMLRAAKGRQPEPGTDMLTCNNS